MNELLDKAAAYFETRPRLAVYIILGSLALGFIGWLV